MKKLIYISVALSLITISLSTASAITQEELITARDTIQKTERTLRAMKRAVNIAIKGTFVNINLTSEQVEELKNRYINEKAKLQPLYGELP